MCVGRPWGWRALRLVHYKDPKRHLSRLSRNHFSRNLLLIAHCSRSPLLPRRQRSAQYPTRYTQYDHKGNTFASCPHCLPRWPFCRISCKVEPHSPPCSGVQPVPNRASLCTRTLKVHSNHRHRPSSYGSREMHLQTSSLLNECSFWYIRRSVARSFLLFGCRLYNSSRSKKFEGPPSSLWLPGKKSGLGNRDWMLLRCRSTRRRYPDWPGRSTRLLLLSRRRRVGLRWMFIWHEVFYDFLRLFLVWLLTTMYS